MPDAVRVIVLDQFQFFAALLAPADAAATLPKRSPLCPPAARFHHALLPESALPAAHAGDTPVVMSVSQALVSSTQSNAWLKSTIEKPWKAHLTP